MSLAIAAREEENVPAERRGADQCCWLCNMDLLLPERGDLVAACGSESYCLPNVESQPLLDVEKSTLVSRSVW